MITNSTTPVLVYHQQAGSKELDVHWTNRNGQFDSNDNDHLEV